MYEVFLCSFYIAQSLSLGSVDCLIAVDLFKSCSWCVDQKP